MEAVAQDKAGWRPVEWAHAVGISRARVYELLQDGRIDSVKDGSARIIITPPRAFCCLYGRNSVMAKTNNEKNRESEARRKAGGEKKASVWVPIGRVAELKAIAACWCAEHRAARRERRAERLAAMAAGGDAA